MEYGTWEYAFSLETQMVTCLNHCHDVMQTAVRCRMTDARIVVVDVLDMAVVNTPVVAVDDHLDT